MREKLRCYDALEKNKAAYLERVSERLIAIWNEELSALCAGYEQADEAACGDRKAAVQAHDAPEEQQPAQERERREGDRERNEKPLAEPAL